MTVENQVLETHRRRYATKVFDRNRSVPPDQWQVLEECLRLTPSSYNLQPWKLVVVTDDDLKAKLRGCSFNQAQVEDCSTFVIFCARSKIDRNWLERLAQLDAEHGLSPERIAKKTATIASDLFERRAHEIYEIAVRQCYIALSNLMTTAAAMGIDTCPLEGFLPSKYNELLGLDVNDWRATVACAVGYRSARDERAMAEKIRFSVDEVFDYRL